MWIRRPIVFLLVAATTAAALLWWLHDGDLAEAVAPLLPGPPPRAPGIP